MRRGAVREPVVEAGGIDEIRPVGRDVVVESAAAAQQLAGTGEYVVHDAHDPGCAAHENEAAARRQVVHERVVDDVQLVPAALRPSAP